MLIRRVNYLEYDDELIRHSAKPDLRDMDLEEIKMALEERGVYSPFLTLPHIPVLRPVVCERLFAAASWLRLDRFMLSCQRSWIRRG